MIVDIELRQILAVEGFQWRGKWVPPGTLLAVETELDAWRASELVAAEMAKPVMVPVIDGEDGCS